MEKEEVNCELEFVKGLLKDTSSRAFQVRLCYQMVRNIEIVLQLSNRLTLHCLARP